MCQFVQQESDKKQESGNDGRRPHRSATPLRRDGAEATDQGQGNEEGDNKPAIVQPDRDTSDSAKPYLGNNLLDSTTVLSYYLDSERRYEQGT